MGEVRLQLGTEFLKGLIGSSFWFPKVGLYLPCGKKKKRRAIPRLKKLLVYISFPVLETCLLTKVFRPLSNNPRAKFACIRRMMGWCFVMHRGNKSILFNVHLLGNQWKQIVRLITIWCTLQLAHFCPFDSSPPPLATQPYTCSYNPSQARLN